MLELKNSKTTYLGKSLDGRDRFAIDAFIGAVQMREDASQLWEDIKPRLVRDNDGWHVEGAPYYAEVKDDGTRLFCPGRNERSKYLRLPSIDLLSGFQIVSDRKLQKAISDWGELAIIFTNTGMHFSILFKKRPPVILKDRLAFGVETAGFDILKLLAEKTGLGIPRPRLIEVGVDPLVAKKRWLNWSFEAGQLELGFDLAGLIFPVMLKNTTIDVSVGASADDCRVFWTGSEWNFNLEATNIIVGYDSSGAYKVGGGMRFQNITIPQGADITVAYIIFVAAGSQSYDTVNSVIIGEKTIDAVAFSTIGDYQARRGTVVGGANDNNITSASVPWNAIPSWVEGATKTSPDISTIEQELVDQALWASGGDQVFYWDDHAGTSTPSNSTERVGASWDHATYNPPILHIQYTAGTTATPPTINFTIGETQSTLNLSQNTPAASLNIGVQIPYHDRGFISPTLGLKIGKKESYLRRTFGIPFITLTLALDIPVVLAGGNVIRTPSTLALITSLLDGRLAFIINGISGSLNTTLQIPAQSRAQYTQTFNLKTNRNVAHLQFTNLTQALHLGLVSKVPKADIDYLIIPLSLALKLGLQIPDIMGVPSLVTPSTTFLVLQMFSPELFSGVFAISKTGRYGVPPSVSWEGILE